MSEKMQGTIDDLEQRLESDLRAFYTLRDMDPENDAQAEVFRQRGITLANRHVATIQAIAMCHIVNSLEIIAKKSNS